MTTIRAYTTIEQSRKLAEILPLESADMLIFNNVGESGNVDGTNCTTILKENLNPLAEAPEILACWSLAALLNVLPDFVLAKYVYYKGDKIWVKYMGKNEKPELFTAMCDNPIDACYEMIIRLNEFELL